MATKSIQQYGSEWSYSNRVPLLVGLFTAVAVFGWIVSTFLSGIHFWGVPQISPDADISGSLEVITSQWAYVGPVPLATLGAFYYLTTILMAVWWLDTRHPLIIKALTPLTASGVVASAYFVYLQLGVIGAICPFCMMSAGASVVLFALELIILRKTTSSSLSVMLDDTSQLLSTTSFKWLILVAAMGLFTLGAFFGVTLAPLPIE